MFQAYSNGIDIAAGATIPLNNVTYSKGCSANLVAPGTIQLDKRGVYVVRVDAYGEVAEAGDFGVQIAVNGIPRLDAINEATGTVGSLTSVNTEAYVVVQQNDCRCNVLSIPTNVQLINPSEVGATNAHYNVTVAKLF